MSNYPTFIFVAMCLQLIFIGITFFIFSSTLYFFPWYEPLTAGAFYLLIAITPVHLIFSFLTWAIELTKFNENKCSKTFFPLTAIQVAALLITMSGEGSSHLFDIISGIGSIAVILLGILSVIIIVKSLRKHKKTSVLS